MFFGSAAVWEIVPGAFEIMTLSYILPVIFFVFWIVLFIKVLVDKYKKKSNKKSTLILFKLTAMFCLMSIVLGLFIRIFAQWYEMQWLLVVLELPTLLILLLFKHYPKHSIIILSVMLALVLIVSVPAAISSYNNLYIIESPHDCKSLILCPI